MINPWQSALSRDLTNIFAEKLFELDTTVSQIKRNLMASPLGWFRRHQKGMMVVFGMVLMAIFGLGSVAMMINPSQLTNPADKEVVVQWDGGKLTKTQVENIRVRHFAAKRFVQGVEMAARGKQENFFPAAFPINWLNEGNIDTRQADAAIVERYLLAERAKKEGMRVSDTMVSDYISLVHNMVNFGPADLERINMEVNGEHMDLVDIRRHLKMELAAQQYRFLLDRGFPITPTPTEAAELYSRLEKTIECTVMPVKVEDFISKVEGSPSNSELKKIFEKGQYLLEDSHPTKPGFKRAKRAKIQYVFAEFDDFLKAEMDKISDKQVQEEYDRLVEAKDSLVMEFVPPETTPDVLPGIDDPAPLPGTEGDDAAPTPPGDSDDPAPPPAKADGTDENKSDTDSSSESTEGGSDEGDGSDKDLSLTVQSASQFVSTGPQEEEEGTNQEKAESTQEGTQKTDETTEAADPDSGDAATQETESKTTEQESGEPKMLDESNQDSGDAALPGEDDQEIDNPVLMRPKPLDVDLAQLIRERMVSDRAMNLMKDQIAQAEADVREQQYEYQDWESLPDAEKKGTEPNITLDLKEMATRLGLQYGETELLNRVDLFESDFGGRRGIVEIPRQFGPPQRTTAPMADIVFANLERQVTYEPGEPVVQEGNKINFLWWPVEIAEMEVLTFADAKPDVLEYWKREQAKELALQHAQDLANSLNAKKERLLDAHPDTSENTGSFTWYSTGFTQPTGVEAPGEEFMKTAFGLKMDESAGALNETGTHAYVVQKIFQDSRDDAQISDSLLSNWTKFQMIPPNVSGTVRQQSSRYRLKTREKIMEEMNVKWVSE